MNILVLNGSPKGKNSVTLQTVLYWELLFPEETFNILHVGQNIKALEKEEKPQNSNETKISISFGEEEEKWAT